MVTWLQCSVCSVHLFGHNQSIVPSALLIMQVRQFGMGATPLHLLMHVYGESLTNEEKQASNEWFLS